METARLWHGFGHWSDEGDFHLHGVTGPDEYAALVNDNVFTNLMAKRNLRGAADAAERHPERGRPARRGPRRGGRLAGRRRRDVHPVRPRARGAPAGRRLHRAARVGLREHRATTTTRCCCTSRTWSCTASRWSSRPIWCWPCSSALVSSPPTRRPATWPTTRPARSATRRCRPPRRPCWPPRSGTWIWRTTCSPSRSSRTWRTWATRPPTGCTWPRWPVRGWRWCRVSAGCATTGRCSPSTPGCRAGSTGWPSACAGAATGCGSR